MSDQGGNYEIAIKVVSDLRALTDLDKSVKLSTDDIAKLSAAMELLRGRSDAASKAAFSAGRAVLARNDWLKSIPEPQVIFSDQNPGRRGSSPPPGIVPTSGSGLASTPAPGQKSPEQLRAEERAAGLETERRMKQEEEQQKLALRARIQRQAEERREAEKARQAEEYAQRQAAEQKRARDTKEAEIHRQRLSQIVKPPQIPDGKDGIGGIAERLKAIKFAFDQAGGGITGFASAIPKVFTTLGPLGVALGAVVAVLFTLKTVLGHIIPLFAEKEKALNRLRAGLVQNGTYTETYFKQLQALSGEMRKLTGIAEKEWLKALSMLAQRGADATNMDQLARAVKNAAGVYGTLETAAMAVSKAMEGQFDTFREHGIYVDRNASQVEKMNQLFRELERVGGGQLEAQMMGLSGAWNSLKTEAEALSIKVGGNVSNFLQIEQVIRLVSDGFEALNDAMETTEETQDAIRVTAHRHITTIAEQQEATRRMAEELRRLDQQYKEHITTLNQAKGAMDAMSNNQQATEDREKERQLAKINQMLKTRMITEEQAVVMRARLEEQFERRSTERKIAAQQRDKELKDAELAASIQHEQNLRAEVERARNDQTTRGAAERQKNIADTAEREAQKTEAKIKSLEKEYKDASVGFAGGPLAAILAARRRSQIEGELENLRGLLPNQRAMADIEKGRSTEVTGAADRSAEKIKDLEEKLRNQEAETQAKRGEAFNTAVIVQDTIRHLSQQQRTQTETRRTEQFTDQFGAREQARQSGLQNNAQQMTDAARRNFHQLALQQIATGQTTVQGLTEMIRLMQLNERDQAAFIAILRQMQQRRQNRPPES